VIGTVYNGVNKPPYLPSDPTKSTIKSQTSPSSGESTPGYNEFRFEDKQYSEEVYIHAQKDFNIDIQNDQNITIVGGSRAIVLEAQAEQNEQTQTGQQGNDSLKLNNGNKSLEIVKGDYSIQLDQGSITIKCSQGDLSFNIEGNVTYTCSGFFNVTAEEGINLKSGSEVTVNSTADTKVDAGGGVSISAGGTVDIEATASVDVTGMTITLNG
jgi:type VI secretion system secreted protein VgrG